MHFDNSVKIAFIISIVCHAFIFFIWPAINILLPKRPAKTFEITYYRIKYYKTVLENQKLQAKKTIQEKPPEAMQAQKEKLLLAAQKKREHLKNTQVKTEGPAKAAANPQPVSSQKDSVIPPLPAGIEKIPSYLDYVQSVREKIKRVANSKYRQRYSSGEVLLNFVLLSDGSLSVIKIIDERSCSNEYLKKIAQESIESASPFKPFPQDLEFRQLSFSVIISFE